MPSVHPFIPVWQRHEAQQTFRTKQYVGAKRKRRANDEEREDEDADEDADTSLQPEPVPVPVPVPVHSQPETPARPPTIDLTDEELKDQYYVAGYPESEPKLPAPFPHKAWLPPGQSKPNAHQDIQKDLTAIKPPLCIPPPEEEDQSTSLRRHHLNVLTTILHTALLRGDYVRAARAWGLILRTDLGGRGIDVRTHGRWGIGAEILLRRDTSTRRREDDTELSGEDEEAPQNGNEIQISDEGFRLAKDYYTSLILQYPYQKQNPHAINALTFYPAMFGLEIFEAQQRSAQARKRLESEHSTHEDSYLSDADDDDDDDDGGAEEHQLAIKRHELLSALSLAGRLDELLISPPYDKYIPLLQLRGMVGLWIADLYEDTVPTARRKRRSSGDEDEDDDDDEQEEDPITRNQRRSNRANARAAREKAKACFLKVQEGGGDVEAYIANID